MIAFVIFWIIVFNPMKYTKKILIIIPLCVIVSYLAINYMSSNEEYRMFERLMHTVKTGDDANRSELMKIAFNIFIENPFFGVGNDFDMSNNPFNVGVHNYQLYILAMHGIFAFLNLIILYFLIIKDLIKGFKYSIYPSILFLYMFAITAKSTSIIQPYMWLVFAMALALNQIKSKQYEKNSVPHR
jgi:O-antigen ligase